MFDRILIYLFCTLLFFSCQNEQTQQHFDVVVLGQGTGAAAAAVQSARSGAKTLLISPIDWLGGMLTAAGVSATDGNHRLHAGLWAEYRQLLRDHYGGTDSLFTGWVSNTMFEPKIGEFYWRKLVQKEENLILWEKCAWGKVVQSEKWEIEIIGESGESQQISAKILVDGTDLGDVAALAGVQYDLGMDAAADSQESMAPEKANDIVQDFTYVAILKDFGDNVDKTISKPEGYDPEPFYCACQTDFCDDEKAHDCEKILSYGKLPNEKYMINWPLNGNDYYANLAEMDKAQREAIYQKAKNYTLQFVYFIQTELGYKNLGLAVDEFPTDDMLALYPYHREGRRIKGLGRLNVNHILRPYDYSLYKTGIAVGDYPIDHHHGENEEAPEIDFPKVPSFSIPAGCLIPQNIDNLLVADKAISVTNIVNGASRLQPVIIQVGQAAGLMAAMSALQNVSPKELDMRKVQVEVLRYKGYLLPLIDVEPDDSDFESIQRVAATGILKAKGIPYKWANQTWFYPDSLVDGTSLIANIREFDPEFNFEISAEPDYEDFAKLLDAWSTHLNLKRQYKGWDFMWVDMLDVLEIAFPVDSYVIPDKVPKRHAAVLIDKIIDPFHLKKISFDGEWKSQ